MRQAGCRGSQRDQLGARGLLGVSRRLERPESRKRMHPVNDAGLFHRAPHALVLGLNRIIAHRVDWPNQADAASFVSYAINFLLGEFGILHREHRREIEPLGILLALSY